ncbi:MAG: ChbG/HpnK family deacetylase [Lachnospiraceae bacterium]|nr:ChbG/HpnK family deacetylase [Lachnospiraceae bacterium]
MSVIVNADDFGKNKDVNNAICEAFEKGYINHTTVMANMPFSHDAFRLATENGFLEKVGIHLNLTEGFPLTDAIKGNPLICSPDGSFNAAFCHNTKYRLYMDSLSISQIKEELDAQLERFLKLGFTSRHIDSHHHVHTNYPVYLALKGLCGKYDFSYIRLSRNLYKGGNIANNIYKALYNRSVRRLCRASGGLFGSYDDLMEYTGGGEASVQNLLSSQNIEIMSHPMYRNGVLCDTDLDMVKYMIFKDHLK